MGTRTMTVADSATTANLHMARLLDLENHTVRVLTVFVNVDSSTAEGRNLHAQLHDLLAPIRKSLDPASDEAQQLDLEERSLRDLLLGAHEGARSVALYSSTTGLRLAIGLPQSVGPAAYWDRRAWLGPLREAANANNWTMVLAADKSVARILLTGFGMIRELARMSGNVPGKQGTGGESQGNFSRHHDAIVGRHAREVVQLLMEWMEHEETGGAIVAAPPEMLAALRAEFPASGALKHVDFFVASADASPSSILEHAQPALARQRAAREAALADMLLEAVGTRRAVVDTAAVLDAVSAGHVQVLVRAAGDVRGAVCSQCELLLPSPGPVCPVCGSAVVEQRDLSEYLADRVTRQGGQCETISGPAAERIGSPVSALLRFRMASMEEPNHQNQTHTI